MAAQRTKPPRFGIEEEFLLLDARTAAPSDVVEEMIAGLPGVRAEHEFFTSQIETATPVCVSSDEAVAALRDFRRRAAAVGEDLGVVLSGTGLPPIGGETRGSVSDVKRYREIAESMRGALDHYYSTGTHVHIEVPSRDAGVQVISRVARWSPLLVALTANSPLWQGRTTGYASWRHLFTQQWPTSGYTPDFADAAAYERVVVDLVNSGSLLDKALVNWSVRLSERFPTIEVRTADSQLRAEDSVAFAMLFRALVARALREYELGDAHEACQADLLRGAHWRAARDGLTGALFDPTAGELRPVDELIDALLVHVGAELEAAGDAELIERFIARRTADRGPAQLQLAVWEAGGVPGLLSLFRAGAAE